MFLAWNSLNYFKKEKIKLLILKSWQLIDSDVEFIIYNICFDFFHCTCLQRNNNKYSIFKIDMSKSMSCQGHKTKILKVILPLWHVGMLIKTFSMLFFFVKVFYYLSSIAINVALAQKTFIFWMFFFSYFSFHSALIYPQPLLKSQKQLLLIHRILNTKKGW